MLYSPFPYKSTPNGALNDGILFPVPSYCKKHCLNKSCKQYYERAFSSSSFVVCEQGFGMCRVEFGEESIVITCLNVEKLTDRNKLRRCIKDKDFLPRLSEDRYGKILEGFINTQIEGRDITKQIIKYKKEKDRLDEINTHIEDLLHEIRQLNKQLKNSVELLSEESNKSIPSGDLLQKYSTDIYSISNLLSIRFDMYDFEINPILNAQEIKILIPIFRRVEKVYKCLKERLYKKNLHFEMLGSSYCQYNASKMLEIAFFIIIDNAIKYSPPNGRIKATFFEESDALTLTFTNHGICPNEDEISHLMERGYRSRRIVQEKDFSGRGIGMYLLNKICEENNVLLKIYLGSKNDRVTYNGYNYTPFNVELKFMGIIDSQSYFF